MSEIIILCHLEHLAPCDSPDKKAYSLNISVAINEATPLNDKIKAVLRPWTAKQITTVSVFVNDPTPRLLAEVPLLQQSWKTQEINAQNFPTATNLVAELNQEFNDYEKDESGTKSTLRFIWKEPEQTTVTKTAEKPWHTFVGQLAQLPTPIPQLLNLSGIFYLDNPNNRPIVAAPILDFLEPIPFKLMPTNTLAILPQLPNRPSIRIWEYQAKTQPPPGENVPELPLVKAYIEECPVRSTLTGPFLDLKTMWVRNPKPAGSTEELNNFGEDWRAMLENRMADAFDLSQRIIEYLRTANANSNSTDFLFKIRQTFLASLRDICAIGLDPTPENRILLEFLAEKSLTANHITEIRNAAAATFSDVTRWAKVISDIFPSLSKLSVLTNPQSITSIQESVAELENLHQFVLSEDNLPTLIKEQWRQISEVPSLSQDAKAVLQAAMGSLKLNEINFRRASALENVGVFWRSFVKSGLTNESGMLEVKNNFACYFLAYGLLRFGRSLTELSRYSPIYPSNPDTQIKQILPAITSERINQLKLMITKTEVNENLRNGTPPLQATESQINEIIQVLDKILLFNELAKEYGILKICPVYALPGSDPNSNPIIDGLLNHIKEWSQNNFEGKLVPQPLKDNGQPADGKFTEEFTEVPHAVTIMVDKLDADPEETDLLSSIAGVGVLMREDIAMKKWQCLNMADARLRQKPDQKAGIKGGVLENGQPLFNFPVLAASRLNYLNDLRQSFVTYNNHPLTAKSPAAMLTKHPAHDEEPLGPVQPDTPQETWETLISYFYANPQLHAEARIPALKFGAKYQVLPFLIGNSGIVPLELAKKTMLVNGINSSPCEIDLDHFDSTSLNTHIRKFTYLRKVRIGHIRAFSLNKVGEQVVEGTCLNLPPIPETVYPRARDIQIGEANKIGQNEEREKPLLLLSAFGTPKSISEFKFYLRLPATDINTWDRWVAGQKIHTSTISGSDLQTLRTNVWREYHHRLRNNSSEKDCQVVPPELNHNIDDPAVALKFFAELEQFDESNGTWKSPSTLRQASLMINLTNSLALDFSRVQTQPLSVTCNLLNTSTEVFQHANNNLQISLIKGKIYRLRVSCCLPIGDFPPDTNAKFARIYQEPLKVIPNENFYKVSEFELFIETATDEIIDKITDKAVAEKTLLEWLKPSFELLPKDPTIPEILKDQAVGVRFKNNTEEQVFSFAYRVELKRQMWRWQGRETKPHPQTLKIPPLNPTDPAYLNEINRWEAREYGNRFDKDHLVINMDSKIEETIPANLKAGKRIFSYTEYLTGNKSKKAELRALHYRFQATIYSRYEGIMLPTQASISTEVWKSLFVPCRLKELEKPPKVKLIFPLTQSFGTSRSDTAGLLVVFDEPWHEIGGIGEGLGVEVVQVQDPDFVPGVQPEAQRNYFEIGFDPIISAQALGSAAAVNVSFPDAEKRGPVGHTFDRSEDAPLLTSTSFIIPAPLVKNNGSATPITFGSWGMCKIKFKRIVLIETIAETNGESSPLRIESPFTVPFWVQYLPEFSLFTELVNSQDKNLKEFSDLRLERIQGQNKVRLTKLQKPGEAVVIKASETSGNNIFERYLILTREVFDVTGHSDQEVYLGVLSPDPQAVGDWKTDDCLDISSLPDSVKLFARIIEIQRRTDGQPTFSTAEELWKRLFEPSIPDFQRCRIVRISEPIYNEAAFKPLCD